MYKRIEQDITTARKNKDNGSLALLTTLKAAIEMVAKSKKNMSPAELKEKDVIPEIRKLINGAEIVLNARESQGQDTSKELNELKILKSYLPKQLTDTELTSVLASIIEKLPEKTVKAFGKVMGELRKNYENQFDGTIAKSIIEQQLK